MTAIARFPLEQLEDIFVLRQAGRVAAATFGFDDAVQVRFATALSELGRELISGARTGSALVSLLEEGTLTFEITGFAPGPAEIASGSGLEAARRLVGSLAVASAGEGCSVTLSLKDHKAVNAQQLQSALERNVTRSPLDELRLENRDLLETLEALRAKQIELEQINRELEETNRGVMAMYTHISGELEETNRGVVALYAELDDKSAQLKEASEAKSRFLASVSHELRSPVTSILGLTKLLRESEGDRSELTLISNSATELLSLVNELLDLAKAESGRLEPDIDAIDLSGLFAELRGSLRPLVREPVTLTIEPPELKRIESDRMLLTQILRNLLTNALKFTNEGQVRLTTRLISSHTVEFSVADTGIGIAPADRAKVFEEFYQVRGAMQIAHRGTGLGLPYARRVARVLGGDITVESELGAGSRFTLTLPTRWPSIASGAAPHESSAGAPAVETVLIIDDDDVFRTTLRGMLQGTARRVIEAACGRDGLEAMARMRPDLVFVDLRMPDIDGSEVVAHMKSTPALAEVPIVVITSADLGTIASLSGRATLMSKSALDRSVLSGAIERALA